MQNWGGTVAAYSAVLYEFFADEIMAPRSAIYFRYNAPRPSPSPLSCRHSSIRQFHFLPRSFSSVSHRASALALASPVSRFSPLFSLFLIFFPHGYSFRAPVPAPRARGTARARARATAKAAAIYWRHSSDRQRTTSGDKIPGPALEKSSGLTGNRNGFSRGYPAHPVSEII